MRRHVAAGVLSLVTAIGVEAQPLTSPGALTRGRELMAQSDPLGAADAFHEALRAGDTGRYTVRVGVYCDVANLERQLRTAGNAPELFVLRRSVGGRPCLALFWGLFPSRAAARAAVSAIPAALHAAGQSPVSLSAVLPPGEPPPTARVAPAPPTATTTAPRALPAAPPPPPAAPAVPEAVAPVAEPPVGRIVEPAPTAPSPITREEPPPAMRPAESIRVPAMEVAVAYSALWDDTFSRDGADGFYELGWTLSLCANLNRSLGVVGDVSGHYTSDDTLDALGVPLTQDRDLLGVHAGLRYTHRHEGFAVPYVQALAGWTRTGLEQSGGREVEDAFSIQPGVGLQLRLSRSVGLGLGADYRVVFGEQESRNEVRLHAGFVIGIGGR